MDTANKPAQPLRQILHIGRITRSHGLRGEVKVQPMTSDPGRFIGLTECLLTSADEKQNSLVRIEGARAMQDQIILKLQGVDDREKADALRGRLLSVRREQAVVLPPDHWFICDLVGCAVYDEAAGYLGQVSDIIQSSAQDVYVVHLANQPDLLFPALKSILLQVDIAGRRLDVRLPAGLFEIYRGG